MTTVSTSPRKSGLAPLADAMARDDTLVFYLITIFVTLVVLAVKFWGLVALAMTALAAVPVVFILLIAITRG